MPFKDVDISYEAIAIEMLQRLQTDGVLTDVNPGSVVRTLMEAFAKELAQAYAQMSVIYDMGFVDTATDESLDHLVALLGIQRISGPQVAGEAVFTRDNAVTDDVKIPKDTLLYKQKAKTGLQVQYRTAADAVLKAGQQSLTLSIIGQVPPADPGENPQTAAENAQRAISLSEDDVGDGSDDTGLMTIAIAIPGVQTVRLLRATTLRQQRETDDELRARSQAVVAAAGGGTAEAVRQALLATGKVKSVTFPDADPPVPGTLSVAVDPDITADQALQAELTDVVNQVKAAGIVVTWHSIVARPVALHLLVTPSPSLDGRQREVLRKSVSHVAGETVRSLRPGEPLRWSTVVSRVMQLKGVDDLSGDVTDHLGTDSPSRGPKGPPPLLFPAEQLRTVERLTLAPVRAPVQVLFHDETIMVQLITSAAPPPQAKAAVVGSLERYLAQAEAASQLAYGELAQAVRAESAMPADRFDGQYLAFQVTYRRGIPVLLSRDGDTAPLSPGLHVIADPKGPRWGVKRP